MAIFLNGGNVKRKKKCIISSKMDIVKKEMKLITRAIHFHNDTVWSVT